MPEAKRPDPKLGSLIPAGEEVARDAVHVAVMPVVLGEDMKPSQHAAFVESASIHTSDPVVVGYSTAGARGFVGIIDPFIGMTNLKLKKGTRVWLCLYPGTITSLRHDWTHPGVPADMSKPEEMYRRLVKLAAAEAETTGPRRYLSEFAEEAGLSYKKLVDGLTDIVDGIDDYIHLNYDTPDIAYNTEKVKKMWEAWEKVTGKEAPDGEKQPFSCAC